MRQPVCSRVNLRRSRFAKNDWPISRCSGTGAAAVSLRTFVRQLKRNTRSWRRTAAIGALLVLGTCLWTPSLLSTVFGTSTMDPAFVDSRSQSPPPPIEIEASFGNIRLAGGPAPGKFNRYHQERTPATDPFVRSVEVGGIRSRSFRTASVESLPTLSISTVSNRRYATS